MCILGAKSPPNGEIVAKNCFRQLLQNYDSDMGGFSKAPKFPQAVNFNFLFAYYAANPKDDKGKQGLKMALHTLDMMAKGGIHDHISQVRAVIFLSKTIRTFVSPTDISMAGLGNSR